MSFLATNIATKMMDKVIENQAEKRSWQMQLDAPGPNHMNTHRPDLMKQHLQYQNDVYMLNQDVEKQNHLRRL